MLRIYYLRADARAARGGRIVFDVDKARKLADGYQSTKK